MNSEYARLTTLLRAPEWIESADGSATCFSRAGFYLDKSSDSVRCAFCDVRFSTSVVLGYRRFVENPAKEHRRINRSCPFFSEASGNVPLSEHVLHDVVDGDPTLEIVRLQSFSGPETQTLKETRVFEDLARSGLYLDHAASVVKCAFCDFAYPSGENLSPSASARVRVEPDRAAQKLHSKAVLRESGGDYRYRCAFVRISENGKAFATNVPSVDTESSCSPRHPRMAGTDRRNISFSRMDLPETLKAKSAELVRCGFFYAGSGDATTCFWCGGIYQNWKEKDCPLSEHVRRNPTCRFLLGLLLPKRTERRIWNA